MREVRSTNDVLHDHLAQRERAAIEEDLRRNYHQDVVFLCEHGAFRGHDAVRKSAEELQKQIGQARFEYTAFSIDDDYALLLWRAHSIKARIDTGVDTFVIREGLIVMQTVFYRLKT